jgi:basic membrane lipoprotein Med (substrate-binding protein (PBP1-ABC) superfamily)
MKATAGLWSARRTVIAACVAVAVAPAAAQTDKPVKVAAVYTVPVGQQWVSRIHKALNAAQARGDIAYVYSENVANAAYPRVLRDYAEAGTDLIVGEAFGVEETARAVAADFPDTAFLMGSSYGPSEPNFSVFDNFLQEASYLTGMIAGAATQSGIIGMVGGYPIPEVNRLMHAFMAGALAVNPEVTFLVDFIDSWDDHAKAREEALAMIERGADVLYAERFGAAEAARERGVKAIGNVIDTAADYPGTILASALWHMEPTVDRAVEAVAAGRFGSADYGPYSTMAHGGATFVVDETLVDSESVAAARAREREIVEGRFKVESDDSEPKSTP